MPLPLSEHPDYGKAMAEYNQALQSAEAEGDQAKIAQARLDWANRTNQLTNDLYDRQQAEVRRREAVAQAKAMVPNIPDAVLAPLTTPEQILQVAESLKAQMGTQPAPQAEAALTPQGGTASQSWGPGAPTGTPAQTPNDPNDPQVFHKRMFERADLIESDAGRQPRAVDEFKTDYFNAFILPGLVRKPGSGQQQR